MGKLDNKVAIITGGASGIGEATVRLFVKEGAKVIIGDILDDYGSKLAEELGSNAEFVHTDVSEEKEVRALIREAKKIGRLDIMMNNAGAGKSTGFFENTSVKDFDWMIGVMLRGTFLGMKHAIRMMKKQGSGSIINMGSVAGLQAGYGPHPYNAAKAGIIQLTRTVAWEVGEFGIRINCICPGGIATAIFGKGLGMSQEKALELIPKIKKLILENSQPIKRAGIPIDIAKTALWLASDDSNFVTGQAIVVDGGLLTGPNREYAEQKLNELAKELGIEL